MKEIVVQHFFEGHATVQELAADAADAFDRQTDSNGTVLSRLYATRMNHDFAVTALHLRKLADSVRASDLSRDALDAICFCLESSDHFTWDGDTSDGARVARGLFLLGTPEINYPLSDTVLAKIGHYLATGEDTLTRADLGQGEASLHPRTVKEWHRPADV